MPALKDNTVSSTLSIRERLAEHRAQRRLRELSQARWTRSASRSRTSTRSAAGGPSRKASPIDATGGLPDGSKFDGVAGLEQALLKRPELFVGTLTEKLLTFALGRGVESYDAPAIRKIVRDARARRLPLLVADRGDRDQHAVSDEEIRMIVTKKALPRRTFLAAWGRRWRCRCWTR